MGTFAQEIEQLHEALLDGFADGEEDVVEVYPVDDPHTPITMRAIFDDESTSIVIGEEVVYASTGPLLAHRSSDHAAKRGDQYEIKGKRYRAADNRPDGRGWNVAVLEAV